MADNDFESVPSREMDLALNENVWDDPLTPIVGVGKMERDLLKINRERDLYGRVAVLDLLALFR